MLSEHIFKGISATIKSAIIRCQAKPNVWFVCCRCTSRTSLHIAGIVFPSLFHPFHYKFTTSFYFYSPVLQELHQGKIYFDTNNLNIYVGSSCVLMQNNQISVVYLEISSYICNSKINENIIQIEALFRR